MTPDQFNDLIAVLRRIADALERRNITPTPVADPPWEQPWPPSIPTPLFPDPSTFPTFPVPVWAKSIYEQGHNPSLNDCLMGPTGDLINKSNPTP